MKRYPTMPSRAFLRTALAGSALAIASSSVFAQPTDNPVTAAFPVGDAFYLNGIEYGNYAWTDDINWSNVYDVTTDLTGAPLFLLSNVTKDDLPPNHPNATAADIAGDASDDLATVQNAIDLLSALGGGVLYFPAGTYVFSDHIVLKDGVVLRGETPAVSDARLATYDPPTDFFFPRLAGIVDDPDVPDFGQRMKPGVATYVNPSDPASIMEIPKKVRVDQTYPNGLTASNYGIVNVDINRAAIEFLQEYMSSGTIDRFSVTFGSDDKNRMQGGNVVVFGNRINNAVDLEWLIAQDGDFNDWQLWPNRVGPHIDIMVKQNAIAANNRINDNHWQVLVNGEPKSAYPVDSFGMATEGVDNSGTTGDPTTDYTNALYRYKRDNGSTFTGGESGLVNSNNKYVLFRYTQGLGIAMNRSSRVGYGGSGPHTPAGEPSLQRMGLACRQNWVFISNRVGYQVAGLGIEVRDNVREDRSGEGVWLDPTGRKPQTNNSATYENRGYDISGDNVFVNNNTWNVQRRLIGTGGYPTIDGEGILIQQNDGQKPVNNWTVTNNSGNSYIGLFKLNNIRNANISNNTVTSDVITVLANPNFFPGVARNVTFNNNTVSGQIRVTADLLDPSTNTVITNNVSSSINMPDYSNSTDAPASLYRDPHYVVWGNNQSVTYDSWGEQNSEEWPTANLVNEQMTVKIVTPAKGQVLTAGVPVTLQVEVVSPETVTSSTLSSVTLYDCSLLDPNQQIQGYTHRTDANSLAGATALTFNAGTGYWEASWTPTAAHLDYGLFVVEAVMGDQTVKDGMRNDPAIDYSFSDPTFAMFGFEDGKAFTVGEPELAIVASGTTPELSFDMVPGGTYMLQRTSDLTNWEYVSGQIITNGNSKATGTLSDSGALPGGPFIYRVVQR